MIPDENASGVGCRGSEAPSLPAPQTLEPAEEVRATPIAVVVHGLAQPALAPLLQFVVAAGGS
jgi:hypothetical protein